MKLFHYDNPVIQALSKVADLMLLNIIALICCIPIFTIGASMTALHYVALKVVRGEDVYWIRDFFKSFKLNFKQATIIWLIFFAILVLLGADIVLMFLVKGTSFPAVIKVIVMAAAIYVLMAATCVFPLLAKFDNPVSRTMKNAFLMSILQLPKVVLMAACYALPVALSVLFYQIIPIMFFVCLAGPSFLAALLYNKFFLKLENGIYEAQAQQAAENGENSENVEKTEPEEDERIFKDELDEALIAANEQKYR